MQKIWRSVSEVQPQSVSNVLQLTCVFVIVVRRLALFFAGGFLAEQLTQWIIFRHPGFRQSIFRFQRRSKPPMFDVSILRGRANASGDHADRVLNKQVAVLGVALS